MSLFEGVEETIARLGLWGRMSLVAITVVALLLLNPNGALADGGDALSSSSASIGDLVWHDENGDGNQNENFGVPEPGISGVVLELWLDSDGNGQISTGDALEGTTTTDADGLYLFSGLASGDYLVKVADSNFESGGELYDFALTTEHNPLSVHLGQGDVYSEADFGYEALASPAGPGSDGGPTAVTLSAFVASSSNLGASTWPWLAVLATLGAGSALWIRQQ